MKIIISSTGNDLGSNVDSRFGRCAYFAVHDTATGTTEFIKNPNKQAEEGAGPASVRLVASLGAEKVVSGEFGFKIKSLLTDLNIRMIILKEEKTISEVIALTPLNQE